MTITPKQIEDGDVFVEVYAMKEDFDGMTLARESEATHYDVALRPDDWDQNDGLAYEEWEDLDLDGATTRVNALEAQYPGIGVSWVNAS